MQIRPVFADPVTYVVLLVLGGEGKTVSVNDFKCAKFNLEMPLMGTFCAYNIIITKVNYM